MPFCCLKHFWGNSQRTFLFRHKSDYHRTKHWNTQKNCFSYPIWKGIILRKIRICLNNCFDQNSRREWILRKTVFLHKMNHILLNYAFVLFWSIFEEIHRELYFLGLKVTLSEMSTEILREFVFLTMFEWGKSWVKFGFGKTTVFNQTIIRG